jgi:hypothetical protein
VFVRSAARIWLAYRVGAMRYGVFTARRALRPSARRPGRHRV